MKGEAAFRELAEAGLNRYAILNWDTLPDEVRASLGTASRQVILLGHGGRRLWEAVMAAGIDSADPIDDYTVHCVQACFTRHFPELPYRLAYPSSRPVGLQRLGELAGWHHASPFRVGIDPHWGSWFAYRAVILADTQLPVTEREVRPAPCCSCHDKQCIGQCPAGALEDGNFALEKCLGFRSQPDSPCQFTCLARVACPVGSEHRYSDAQLRHSYGISLRMIRDLGKNPR